MKKFGIQKKVSYLCYTEMIIYSPLKLYFMRTAIFFLFLLAVSAKSQDCKYAINKNGILETPQEVLSYNRDLSGIMATAKKEGNFKYLELYMFLSKKAAFDKNNTFQIILTDGTIVTGIFAEYGRTSYSDVVGYHVVNIKVFFANEFLEILARVPTASIKMSANGDDIEMNAPPSNKIMEIIKCIL